MVDRLLAAGADPLAGLRSLFQIASRRRFVLVLGMLQRSEPAAYANKADALQYASAVGDGGVVEEAI